MANYTPPGVFVADNTMASFSATTVIPSTVGIFGAAASKLVFTETIEIPADSEGNVVESAMLSRPNVSNLSATLTETGEQVSKTTDYELVETVATDGAKYTSIKRVKASTKLVAGGARITVTYNYKPANFESALRFSSLVDVEAFYGPAIDEDGNIESEVSLAASLAFLNGAPAVIIAGFQGSAEKDYLGALAKLEKQRDVAIITTTSGETSVLQAVSRSVSASSSSEMERRAIVGLGGASKQVSVENIEQAASQIKNKRVALVAPAHANHWSQASGKLVKVGGQYIAAAIAGLAVTLPVEAPLTRKNVAGFASLDRSIENAQKNALAAAGVMFVDETITGVQRVRHGVTTDNTSRNTSEWSVVGVIDYMIASVRTTLDNSGFIGHPITGSTIPAITGMIDSLLTSAVAGNVILAYDEVSVVQRSSEPDVIDVRFAIEFLFPLNRIYVSMSSSNISGTTTVDVAA